MPTSLRSTSQSLQALLRRELIADARVAPFFNPALGGTMAVTLTNPEEMTTALLEGISLWLFEVRRDEQRLNAAPLRRAPDRLEPTPLPLCLHYLLTPVVRDDPANPERSPELEQTLLGKALQVFYEHPRLTGADLAGDLTGTDESIHIRLESLPIEDIARVWFGLQRPYQLSVCYEVSLAHVRPGAHPIRVAPVTELAPIHGLLVGPQERP